MSIDINADLGEGFGVWRLGDDEALLGVVSSANIACGFHAGDPAIMRRTCAAAARRGVVIGAQVSYRDLAGFGRRAMEVPADELTADVLYQIAALDGIARAEGSRVRYVKPHGALYHRIVTDHDQAGAVLAALTAYDPGLPLLTLASSAVHGLAPDTGVSTVSECFADRAYTREARLVPRDRPGAVLHDPAEVAGRAVDMAVHARVDSVEGTRIPIEARSICVHGDTPDAVALARSVRAGLEQAGVAVGPFA